MVSVQTSKFIILCGNSLLNPRWLNTKIQRIVSERNAVPKIQEMGGRVLHGVLEGKLPATLTNEIIPKTFRTNLEEEIRWSSDKSLRKLLGIKHSFVNWVELSNTDVKDEDLSILQGFNGLEYLAIMNTGITDNAVPYLTDFDSLQILLLQNTKVTEVGIERLQQALPECEILR